MNKSQLYNLAGSVWGVVGLFLTARGAWMYQQAMTEQQATQQAVIISIIVALIIGGAKGKFVLTKTARRNKTRIDQLAEPLKTHQVYDKAFYFFIIGMMALGFLLRTFNEFLGGYVVVAAIYCGIGVALMVSSLVYWKSPAPSTVEESS